MNLTRFHGIPPAGSAATAVLVTGLLLLTSHPVVASAEVATPQRPSLDLAPVDPVAAARTSLAEGHGPTILSTVSANWTQEMAPLSGWEPLMAYDNADAEVVLFQGLSGATSNDTWTYAGGVWTELNLTPSPPAVFGGAMTYDSVDREVVLFGGATSTGHFLNATWTFSGGRWSELSNVTTGAPPAREYASMAYDSVRGEVLLFGGTNAYWFSYNCSGQNFQDTWEFSGGKWRQVAVGSSAIPLPRYGAGLAFDPDSNTSVLFGGAFYQCSLNSTWLYGDTWSFNGTGWTNVTSTPAPSARLRPGFDYSMQAGALVLVGGSTGGVPFYIGEGARNDTWEFANGTWRQLDLLGPPSGDTGDPLIAAPNGELLLFGVPLWAFNGTAWALSGGGPLPSVTWSPLLVYDSSAGYVLFYGGEGVDYQVGTTWAFEHGRWFNLTRWQNVSPPRGNGDVVSDDPSDGSVLLFAGSAATTWEFRAGNWSQLHPTRAPSARLGASMAYDAADGYVVLVGGMACAPGYFWNECSWGTETWEFHRGTWSVIFTGAAPGPTSRLGAGLAYDAAAHEIVLFGGLQCLRGNQTCRGLDDTWTYSADSWRQLSFAGGTPSARAFDAMTYDASAGTVVMFGGSISGFESAFVRNEQETWAFNGSHWSLVVPPPSAFAPGESDQPALAYVPDLGADLLCQWTGNAWLVRLNSSNSTVGLPDLAPPGPGGKALAEPSPSRVPAQIGVGGTLRIIPAVTPAGGFIPPSARRWTDRPLNP